MRDSNLLAPSCPPSKDSASERPWMGHDIIGLWATIVDDSDSDGSLAGCNLSVSQ